MNKDEKVLNKNSILIGAIILITGISLVALNYPTINYYKIIPKSIVFVVISIFCGFYSRKPIPKKTYYSLLAITILASLIAVYKT